MLLSVQSLLNITVKKTKKNHEIYIKYLWLDSFLNGGIFCWQPERVPAWNTIIIITSFSKYHVTAYPLDVWLSSPACGGSVRLRLRMRTPWRGPCAACQTDTGTCSARRTASYHQICYLGNWMYFTQDSHKLKLWLTLALEEPSWFCHLSSTPPRFPWRCSCWRRTHQSCTAGSCCCCQWGTLALTRLRTEASIACCCIIAGTTTTAAGTASTLYWPAEILQSTKTGRVTWPWQL